MSFKKIFLLTLLLTFSFLYAQVRVVGDLGGKWKATVMGFASEYDTKFGLTVGYDHMLNDMLGVGAEHQLKREITENNDGGGGKFGFTSVYGVAKYNPGNVPGFPKGIYGFARAGYALVHSGDTTYGEGIDLKGGLMFGLGAGFKLNDNLSLEGGYYSNAGTGSVSEDGMTIEMDVTYTRVNAALVYSF